MSEHAIQFKGWQMGTWFILDQSEITQQLRLMMENKDSGTKVKVRLDKNGLKLTKLNTLQLMSGDKKIPLSQIKNISTDPKFPLCFFCTTRGPDGYLMKVIVIRCDKELCAKGIVNYYRTITYKKSVGFAPIVNNETPAVVAANKQAITTSVVKDGYAQIKDIQEDNKKVMEPVKRMESIEVNRVQDKDIEGAETQAKNIKSLSAKVNAIEQNTLKKHRATISHQEYINAHETVRQFEAEVTKRNSQKVMNGYHYPNANAQVTVQNNPATTFQRKPEKYYILNKEGKLVEAVRKRAKTVNADTRMYRENSQHRDRIRLVQLSNKENGEIKPLALPEDSNVTSQTTVQVNESNPDDSNNNTTVAQEPIYAQVKKRALKEPANEQMNIQVPNPGNGNPGNGNLENGPSGNVQEVSTPSAINRSVKFNNWSTDVQRSSRKENRVRARPQSFQMPTQQSIPFNTYVSKPIEKVYNTHSSHYRSLKQKEHIRPRVNSVTFNDGKQLVIYRKGDMMI